MAVGTDTYLIPIEFVAAAAAVDHPSINVAVILLPRAAVSLTVLDIHLTSHQAGTGRYTEEAAISYIATTFNGTTRRIHRPLTDCSIFNNKFSLTLSLSLIRGIGTARSQWSLSQCQ